MEEKIQRIVLGAGEMTVSGDDPNYFVLLDDDPRGQCKRCGCWVVFRGNYRPGDTRPEDCDCDCHTAWKIAQGFYRGN